MKILFISDTYYPHINGVYYFVCRIGPLLRKKGHEIAVIAPSESIFYSQKRIDDLDVYGLPSLPIFYGLTIRVPIPVMLKQRIKRIIQQFKPDIIHLQDHFSLSKMALSITRHLKINHFMPENITVLVHGNKWKQRVEKFLWKGFSRVYNQVSLVTTPTETGARLIRPKLKVDAIAISSGVDLEKFTPSGDTTEIKQKYAIPNKPILLYVGRLDPEKHIEEILEAVALTVKKIDFCFIVVGKGTRKTALERLAHKLGIADHIIFTGFVPDADLPYFYKLGRCFIIASIAELLSLATLQAMASGMPVIAVNAGALGELVKNTMNGYLFDEGDISAIAHYTENILVSDRLYHEMSEKSLEYVQQHNISKTLESFEKLYEAQVNG